MTFPLAFDRCPLSDGARWFCGKARDFACMTMTTLFLSKVYSSLTSAYPPVVTIAIASGVGYSLIKERDFVYKTYRIAESYLYKNYSSSYKKFAELAIQKVLSDEMAPKWMQAKNFSHPDAVSYLQTCIKGGTCDGEVRTFLGCVGYDQNWQREDHELDEKIKPTSYVTYQVMREIMHEMKDYARSLEKPPEELWSFCIKYDPYFEYGRHEVYKRIAGARALDLVFREIAPIVSESSKDQKAVLVGKFEYFGGEKGVRGHAISAQFNFSHYRFRDGAFFSFASQDALIDKLYAWSETYLRTYTTTQFTLWKIPVL